MLSALGHHGLVFLTWDEDGTDAACCKLAHGGHIPTILFGGRAKRGFRDATPFDSYSILRTIEDLWGLKALRRASCACTASMTSMLR